MSKITPVVNWESVASATWKINDAIKTVEVDVTISWDGNVWTPLSISWHTWATEAHWATWAVVWTTNTQTFTNKTIDDYTNTVHADAVHLRVKNSGGVAINKGQPVAIQGIT